MCKGGNPNTLKLKIKQICGVILRVWCSALYTKQFCFGLVHFRRKKNQFRFFSEKIVTVSLAGNFTMENALFKNIFLHKSLFVNQFPNFFQHFLRLLECKIVKSL